MTTISDTNTTATPTYMIPSMTVLKPPEKLTDMSLEGFKKWKKRFGMYSIASGASAMLEQVQIAILFHCIGESCIDVFNTFTFVENEDK